MEPIFDETTERVYARLPDHYRRLDAGNDWQMKRYLSGIAGVQDEISQLIERFDFTPLDDGGLPGDTSDLVNPSTADLTWLPWLGQLFGTQISGNPLESNRQEIITNTNGFRTGTSDAIAAAVQSELIGTKTVRLTKHFTTNGAGGQWDLLISTLSSETLINLVDETTAQTLSPSVWDDQYSSGSYDPTQVWKRLAVQPGMYQNRVLSYKLRDDTWVDPGASGGSGGSGAFGDGAFGAGTFGVGDGSSGSLSQAYLSTRSKIAVDQGDSFQYMISLGLRQAVVANRTASIGYIFYDTNNAIISGTYETSVALTGSSAEVTPMTQFATRFTAPVGAVAARLFVRVGGFDGNDELLIAQPGMREEEDTIWVPRSADPIRAVIEKNAKPAGMKLWYQHLVSTWEHITANDTRQWSEIDGRTWTEVEEL